MKITKQYIWGYSPFCSCLTIKESYNWWITRRELGLDIKYLKQIIKKSRSQISGSTQEKFHRRTKWLRNFADVQDGCEMISQPKVDCTALRNWPSAWCDRLPMALTSSFQLRFANRLKHWIVDFLIFKTTYSMYKLDFRKCSKSSWNDCHQECFMADILFTSPPCIPDCLWKRTLKLQSFGS